MRTAIFMCALLLSAASNAADVSPYLGIGYDTGGDTLAEVGFVEGGSQKVRAGRGFSLMGGMDVTANENIMVRTTLGYKLDEVSADNGDLKFSRNTLDVVTYTLLGEHAMGLGITQHRRVKLSCHISGVCSGSESFSNADGLIVEYLYAPKTDAKMGMTFGLRYTDISYKLGSSPNIDGSAVGATVGIKF